MIASLVLVVLGMLREATAFGSGNPLPARPALHAGKDIKCGLSRFPAAPATQAGDHLYIWGVEGQTFENAVMQVSKNLMDNGYDYSDIVLMSVYLANEADITPTGAAVRALFPVDQQPAIEVINQGLCDGARIQISVTAVKGDKTYFPLGVKVGKFGYLANIVSSGDFNKQLKAIQSHLTTMGMDLNDWAGHLLQMPPTATIDELNDQVTEFNNDLNAFVPDNEGKTFAAMSAFPAYEGAVATWRSVVIAHQPLTGDLVSAPTTPKNGFLAPYSPVATAGDIALLSGVASYAGGSLADQTKEIWGGLNANLAKVGTSASDVFAVQFFMSEDGYEGEVAFAGMMTELNSLMPDVPRTTSVMFAPMLGGGPGVEIRMYARI